MYFPVGWPKRLHVIVEDSSPLVHTSCNPDRMLFAVLTQKSLALWFCRPSVQIVCFRRSDNSVLQFGTNCSAKWRPDSSMVAVATSRGYILFFKVEVDTTNKTNVLFLQKEERRVGTKREVVEHGTGDHVPALSLTQSAYIQIPGQVKSMVCLRDELMVADGEGFLQRIKWDGLINHDMTIELSSIPFSIDLQHSRASQLSTGEVYVSDLQYSPLLGGFALVLSSGQAAFITANSLKFEPSQVVGVLAQEAKGATSVAVNHKYTLIAFGCASGEGIVYNLDEMTGALQVSYRMVLSSKDFSDAGHMCGGVSQLQWSPDGCVLAMSWTRGGFSLWSAYGALLLHSMGADIGGSMSEDTNRGPILQLKSMEWGCEGYHMWMVSVERSSLNTSLTKDHLSKPSLLQLHFVKSALTVNPSMSNHEHLFLQGEDKLYLNPEDALPRMTNPAVLNDTCPSTFIGNKQWQIVPIPHTYLAHNWPVRYATLSKSGHCVAVAGKTGLAHYALHSRRWKLFGNETQEHDMTVTGGLVWWREFICAACFNLMDQRDEIRFYPRDPKLDNTFLSVVRVPSQVLLLNTFKDLLIVLCADCHIMLYSIERRNTQQFPAVNLNKIQEVAIGNFIPHPATVVALTLTTIRTDMASVKIAPQHDEAESIVINVAGRLLMFQRDRSGAQQAKGKDNKDRPLPFCAPVVVASQVENMWMCMNPSKQKPHLTEALWLGCGAAGVKVWLPLHPREDNSHRTQGFMSKRIMLPFHVDLYPLALLFEAGVIMGATSETLSYSSSSTIEEGWPYLQLERTSQVYLHHMLKQLLRRNLGVHALDIARSCTDLPYFPHALELLLHTTLEEEATSKDPIPDPLLPRVAAFVQEFPQYLQTVAHCARKSEVALWPHLFNTVGNPKDLFEECLTTGNLDTAASYLIILQNLEKPPVARQHATLLLDAALDGCKWDLARDLIRFLSAIDPSDADSPNPPSKTRINANPVYPTTFPSPPMSPKDGNFIYPRGRSLSMSVKEEHGKDNNVKLKDKSKALRTDSSQSMKSRHVSGSSRDDSSTDQFFIDVILTRHARKLLSAYKLRDLAAFAANLEDYQLVTWLRNERLRAAKIEDFVAALKKVHEDFVWPLPILTLSTLHRINSVSSLHSSSALTSPLELDVLPEGSGCPPPLVGNCPEAVLASRIRETLVMPGNSQNGGTPDSNSQTTADILLQPQISSSTEDGSLATTEASESGSYFGEQDSADSSAWADSLCLSELEQLSMELANKGPQQSEIELRYLFHILLEAGCLEWAMLMAIVLRDAMAVVHTVNTASLSDTPLEIVGRMREGLSFLELWANTVCIGYKPFLQAIQSQSRQLQKLVEQNPPTSRLSLPSRLSTSSTDSNPGPLDQSQHIERDVLPPTEETPPPPPINEEPTPEEGGGCVIS